MNKKPHTLRAPKLQKGDTIGIIAPSKNFNERHKKHLFNAIEKLEEAGFQIILSKNCFAVDRYQVSAGTPQQRADDFNEMITNSNIDAIYCAHGGDSALQIVSLIDYENIKRNPKIFIGMSDIDVLHLAIHTKTGLITFHGADPKVGNNEQIDISYSWENFQNRLMQMSKKITPASPRKCIRKGEATGKILGINLSSLLKLAGTPYFPDFSDSILFLEGYSETTKELLYKLQQLKEIGVFDRICGIVIGYIYGFQNPQARKENGITYEYEDILLDITHQYNFPILKTDDFGHKCPNCFLPIGTRAYMNAEKKEITILDDFLEL